MGRSISSRPCPSLVSGCRICVQPALIRSFSAAVVVTNRRLVYVPCRNGRGGKCEILARCFVSRFVLDKVVAYFDYSGSPIPYRREATQAGTVCICPMFAPDPYLCRCICCVRIIYSKVNKGPTLPGTAYRVYVCCSQIVLLFTPDFWETLVPNKTTSCLSCLHSCVTPAVTRFQATKKINQGRGCMTRCPDIKKCSTSEVVVRSTYLDGVPGMYQHDVSFSRLPGSIYGISVKHKK